MENNNESALLIKGTFELSILLMMARNTISLTTEEIETQMNNRTGERVAINALYVTLARLLKRGMIEIGGKTLVENKQVGRAKNKYRITAGGENATEKTICYLKSLM